MFSRRLRPEGGAGGRAESPHASSNRQQLCRKQSPMVGPDAPTPAREKGLQPHGVFYCFGRQGGAGGRAESPQCARRRKPLPRWGLMRRLRRGLGLAVPWGALLLRVATEGFQRASGKPFGAPAGAYSFRGPDAPTPARIGTGRPMGRSHFSFGGERKVCKRKPAARRLREKALYCPF